MALVRRFSIQRIDNGRSEQTIDNVAVEEPLEVRIKYWFKDVQIANSLTVTMRTPGHDRELAAGFLFSEGVIRSCEQLVEVRSLGTDPSNEIMAELSKDTDFEAWRLARISFVNSSCGVCGKRTREAISTQIMRPTDATFRLNRSWLTQLPARLREHQEGFSKTGGLHAAALVNGAGEIDMVFEDIGRHNALDKLIGYCVFEHRMPLKNYLIFLSSRSSFELVQKTLMAGAPALATVGGPSSLAIETAKEYGLTLIGFIRGGHFNVYSGEWRID